MGRGAAAAALALVVACGVQDPPSADGEPAWAIEVDAVVAELAAAYDRQDIYETARFFSAGGTLDLSTWSGGVATTPQEVVEALETMWFQEPGRADVHPWHVFVTPDAALVAWGASDPGGFQDWMQTYVFGPRGQAASQAFRALEYPWEDYGEGEADVVALLDRYLAAWNGDLDAASDVYADDVVVRDDVADEVWLGIDEVTAAIEASPPMAEGPWPALYVYRPAGFESGVSQAIAIVQTAGTCPELGARRWVLDAGRIVNEAVVTHVPSARRCRDDLPDGWWSTFELPPELLDNVTAVIDVGGSSARLINAEPLHESFTRWLFARYADAGIGLPQPAAIWFPPSPECLDVTGWAHASDERYDGHRTAVVCYGVDDIVSDRNESGWSGIASTTALHELGHLWMLDHVDAEVEDAFLDRTGLATWNAPAVPWRERGVEHAACTLAWGVAGVDDARYPILPAPSCAELAARYEVLTGTSPVTACGPDGWSPP